jgi:hypothetical protein
VRVMFGLMFSLLVVSSTAGAQSLVLQGAAGATLIDSGYSLAAGIGFTPNSRLTVLFDVERTHLSSRFSGDGRGGGAAFRGGTITFAAAELRASLFPRERVTPYVLGGLGAGVSRPNVNERFPNPVTNNVRVFFGGGGIHVPLGERISVFGDVRMVIGAEAGELLAMVPLRGGVAWRF